MGSLYVPYSCAEPLGKYTPSVPVGLVCCLKALLGEPSAAEECLWLVAYLKTFFADVDSFLACLYLCMYNSREINRYR